MRVVTMSLMLVVESMPFVCGCRATPSLPITRACLDHHLDALTDLVGAPKLAAALMLVELLLYLFWA